MRRSAFAGPILVFSFLFLFLFAAAPAGATQQGGEGGAETINLFFDCQTGGCFDLDYFRREIPYVNWVRDREAADVHVLVTSQTTGGGGRSFTLAFYGLGGREGEDQEAVVATPGAATDDERRTAIAHRLSLGLARYLLATPVAERLRVNLPGQVGGAPGARGPGGPGGAQTSAEDDPWDYWVFRVAGNGFVNGESTIRFANYFGSVSANRTTETWKISLSANRSEQIQEFELPDTLIEAKTTDWGVSGSLVRSLGERWALGVRLNTGSSSRLNQDVRVSVRPGIEYNIFPYAESTRRSLTLQYLVGPFHWNYTEQTIFGFDNETRWQESLRASLELIQPWGRWSTSLNGAHYLHDAEKYSVTVAGNLNVRLFRGFSIRVSGNYSWIRDQLYIPAEGASDEDILLRQRQLETSFRYFTSFGIEYRFGSIFNNVVNPRFGGGDGDLVFFF